MEKLGLPSLQLLLASSLNKFPAISKNTGGRSDELEYTTVLDPEGSLKPHRKSEYVYFSIYELNLVTHGNVSFIKI